MTTDYSPPPAYGSSETGQDIALVLVNIDTSAEAAEEPKTGHFGGPVMPRYVYYRVYAPDGAIPSKTAPDRGNPFIGRVKATSVPPPHNLLSLKRTLGEAEGLPDSTGGRTSIYALASATNALEGTDPVALLGRGLGETPALALALVFGEDLPEKESAGRPSIDESACTYTRQYVYYHLHTLSGDEPSARAFDLTEPSIGRIDKMDIAPPNDVLSTKRCIARAEGKGIYKVADLYGDARELMPWADKTHLVDDKGGFPGSTMAAPLLIVKPERSPGLHNRPLKVLEAQSDARTAFWNSDLTWLEASAGEVVHTDGVLRTENHRGHDRRVTGYMAVNSAGKTGLIAAEKTKFLDQY
ncbi:hypothetical protein DFH09DRAFT_1185606 [Mycena vulgaris]|nr:hypothetical protein DFH09DRAFT_1185606 [Mycena vulgaris]